jgi:hypothetical protein
MGWGFGLLVCLLGGLVVGLEFWFFHAWNLGLSLSGILASPCFLIGLLAFPLCGAMLST